MQQSKTSNCNHYPDHGHKEERKFGKHGEHAHDYFINENGDVVHGKARELNDSERLENGDIL